VRAQILETIAAQRVDQQIADRTRDLDTRLPSPRTSTRLQGIGS
jgi:hypothetical protein